MVMKEHILRRLIGRNIHWFIAIVLFAIPFFWLKPGEMDLGGDSGRLYFYDPVSFIRNVSIYHQVPEGLAPADPNTYYLPYVSFIAVLLFIFRSSTIVISIISGAKLSIGFLAVYGIVKTLLESQKAKQAGELAATMAGMFYILAPTMIGNYDKALTSHNQVFLNPLMFYLLFRFITKSDPLYLLAGLGISFVFAPNFALTSAPPFFAFYPLAIGYVVLYTKLVLKNKLPWGWIFAGAILFLGIHAFHLIPQIMNLFEPGSFTNTRVFDRSSIAHEGVRYFLAVLPLANVTSRILMVPAISWLWWSGIFAPLVVVIGLMRAKKDKTLLLTAVFYLLTLYLYSAKITDIGVAIYKKLFYVPGFSMFRNFIGQWPSVYTFYFALLLGLSIFAVLRKMKFRLWMIMVSVAVSIIWITGASSFLKGEPVNKFHAQSNNIPMTFAMDPRYEKALEFMRSLPDDGKILTLPLTDAYYQVLSGASGGAYVGTSTISQLTGKKDFNGYQLFGQFSEDFMKYVREKDTVKITDLLSTLSVRYIFHNSDPKIYEEGFPQSPYTYMKTSFPKTQAEYEQFISSLPVKRVYENGPYTIYELDVSVRKPVVYIASSSGGSIDPEPKVTVTKSDPVTYHISVFDQGGTPGVLIFHDMYNSNWSLAVNGAPVPKDRHFMIDGYANAWKLSQDDRNDEKRYTMTLSLRSQSRVWFGWGITVLSLVLLGIAAIRRIVYHTI